MTWQASSIFIVLSFGFLTAPLTLASLLSNEMSLKETLLEYSIPILASIAFSLSLLIAGILLLYNLRVANLRNYIVVNRIRKYLKIDYSTIDNLKIISTKWRKYDVEDFKKDAENRFSIWGILTHLYLTLVYVILFALLCLYAEIYQYTDLSIIIACPVLWFFFTYFIWKVIAYEVYKNFTEG